MKATSLPLGDTAISRAPPVTGKTRSLLLLASAAMVIRTLCDFGPPASLGDFGEASPAASLGDFGEASAAASLGDFGEASAAAGFIV